ncbi:hypothetical protein MFIFM68171_11017 [Madurella fahalii]|uniref:Uncharacterized protein n=1 Tax=Madurella fahalii TaxID=1157608 RepID=A0ABQ0GSV5_9PEZI
MESWEGHNYLTSLPTKWVELMNLSTAEWNLGWLPPNVVAIPGALNDTHNFPSGTFVIENAARTDLGSRNAEAVVFGLCSAVALVWGVGWLFWSIKDGTLLKPRPGAARLLSRGRHSGETLAAGHEDGSEEGMGGAGWGGFHAAEFEKRLDKYYPRFASHAEVYERDGRGALEAGEVVGVSELLVRIFRNDTQLKALQSAPGVGSDEMERLRAQSDAMLAEVHRRVNTWTVQGLSEDERREVRAVKTALARHQPPRYRHREGWTQMEV